MREHDNLYLGGLAGASNADHEALSELYPMPFDRHASLVSQSISSRQVMQWEDTESPGTPESTRAVARAAGIRSVVAAPLLRHSEGIGYINTPKPGFQLSEKQLSLLKAFADQAVIAIENTRLFEAEQASKSELQESLEYQTAMSEVGSVISRSPNDLNPVLKAIGEIACRLCTAYDVAIFFRRGDKLRLMFGSGPIAGYATGHDFALTRGTRSLCTSQISKWKPRSSRRALPMLPSRAIVPF